VALWPATGGSLADAASGAYDQHFAVLAQNLIAAGLGSATIRLGWEFNGSWYRWSVTTPASAADFAQAWRGIVGAMRGVPGANFSFDWAPTLSAGGPDPALAYPGDAYVSDIGLDVYDWNESPGAGPVARWSALVDNGYGLAWQANFAAAHGKPIAFPEWGLSDNQYSPTVSGGDDAMFVQNMYAWFAGHHVAFENYFDSDTSYGLSYGLNTGNGLFPAASALYQRLY
jgi:beta-mannanase